MLKLDLTGHSSHVSFSRNILSSSSRALKGWSREKRRSHHLSINDVMPFHSFNQLPRFEVSRLNVLTYTKPVKVTDAK